MATIKEWEKSLDTLTTDELNKMREAFHHLSKWELFAQEYKSDLMVLRMVVRDEIGNRESKKRKLIRL